MPFIHSSVSFCVPLSCLLLQIFIIGNIFVNENPPNKRFPVFFPPTVQHDEACHNSDYERWREIHAEYVMRDGERYIDQTIRSSGFIRHQCIGREHCPLPPHLNSIFQCLLRSSFQNFHFHVHCAV